MLVGLRYGYSKVLESIGKKKKFYFLIIVCRECGGLCCWSNTHMFSGEPGVKELQYWEIAERICCKCSRGDWKCSYCKKR